MRLLPNYSAYKLQEVRTEISFYIYYDLEWSNLLYMYDRTFVVILKKKVEGNNSINKYYYIVII